jgi:hypothetical protein
LLFFAYWLTHFTTQGKFPSMPSTPSTTWPIFMPSLLPLLMVICFFNRDWLRELTRANVNASNYVYCLLFVSWSLFFFSIKIMKLHIISYHSIVFWWGQYEFLWTLKMIFTEAFRLRWILISKVHKNSHWPIQKTVIVLLH